jgi:RNA-directed DNA polymerase
MSQGLRWVLDIDIVKYFDSIPHSHLRDFLDRRVTDGVIRRMIDKWLKAGVLEDGLLRHTTEGSPQGGVVYDAVMAFADFRDAQRVLEALAKRLDRYGLKLHPGKTRLVDFRNNRSDGTHHPETDGTAFSFLGFCHVWGKSRKGKKVVRQVTDKKRYARALAAVTDWCRTNRHRSMRDQHDHLTKTMRGHYAYYGITGNIRRLRWYSHQVVRIWRKWLSRRDRRGRFLWSRLEAILKRHPLPSASIVHRYTAASETLP